MSKCSKTPDIMAWYEKEGALDTNHVHGCPDCQQEKASLGEFYQAAQELKNNVLIPKDIERRLSRLSASSIILEATRRDLKFWTAAAKIESILLLIMGLSLLTLLGKIWHPANENHPYAAREISMPAESLQKSDQPVTTEKIEKTSAPQKLRKEVSAKEKSKSSNSSEETLQTTEQVAFNNEKDENPNDTAEAELQVQAKETPPADASVELSSQDFASIKADQKADTKKSLEESHNVSSSIEEDAAKTDIEISSNQIQQNNDVPASNSPASAEPGQTSPASVELQGGGSPAEVTVQESGSTDDTEISSQDEETGIQQYHSENNEDTTTDYSKVLESGTDSLNSSIHQGTVVLPVSNEHYLTGNTNSLSRSRRGASVEWQAGIAAALPVLLGNGFILDKNEAFHPLFKRALDEMKNEKPKDFPFSKPKDPGSKKPLISNLSFKDALKDNQNLEIPPYDEGYGDNDQVNSSEIPSVNPEDKDQASEWKTNTQKDAIKGQKFDHQPNISKEAIEKLGPGSKDNHHQKFKPPKEKGPKPPGGKVPKFHPPINKAFTPPGSKAPLPPGGKGPPPPGGL